MYEKGIKDFKSVLKMPLVVYLKVQINNFGQVWLMHYY